MSNKLLFPNSFKKIGWLILIPSFIVGVLALAEVIDLSSLQARVPAIKYDDLAKTQYLTIIDTDTLGTIIGALFIIGGLLVGFSKEKNEDEYIRELRLSSLMWAVWVNYVLLLFCFLTIYGIAFMSVMVYNMFTVLIIFIIRFHFILSRSNRVTS